MSFVVIATQIAGGEQENTWTDGRARWWAGEPSWVPSSSSFPYSSISPTFLPVLTHSSYPPVSFVFPFLSLPFLLFRYPLLQTLRGLGRLGWIGWGWLRCLFWHLSRALWLTVPSTSVSCGERHFLQEDGLWWLNTCEMDARWSQTHKVFVLIYALILWLSGCRE